MVLRYLFYEDSSKILEIIERLTKQTNLWMVHVHIEHFDTFFWMELSFFLIELSFTSNCIFSSIKPSQISLETAKEKCLTYMVPTYMEIPTCRIQCSYADCFHHFIPCCGGCFLNSLRRAQFSIQVLNCMRRDFSLSGVLNSHDDEWHAAEWHASSLSYSVY